MGKTRIHTTHPRTNRNVAMPNRTVWKTKQQPGQPSQTPGKNTQRQNYHKAFKTKSQMPTLQHRIQQCHCPTNALRNDKRKYDMETNEM